MDDDRGGQGMDFSKGTRVTFVDGLGGKFGTGLNDIEKCILDAVERQKEREERRVVVVLDGVDFLVAGMGAEVEEVMDMVQEIRHVCGVWVPPFQLSQYRLILAKIKEHREESTRIS